MDTYNLSIEKEETGGQCIVWGPYVIRSELQLWLGKILRFYSQKSESQTQKQTKS